MKIFAATSIVLAFALPLTAQAAATRLTEAQLRVNAKVVEFCKAKNAAVASAKYVADTGNEVTVTCTGSTLLPMTGLGGLSSTAVAGIVVGSVVLAAIVGDNNAPNTTQ